MLMQIAHRLVIHP